MGSITLMKALFLSGVLLMAGAGAHAESPATNSADLESARLALGKWVETQQIVAKEKRDWQQAREILTARIELVRSQIAALEEKLKHTEGSTADLDKKKAELILQNETLGAVAASMTKNVTALEAQTRQLHTRLPEPLQEKIKPLYDRMPADSANTRVSLAERFQNVLGIFNEVNKLNGEIIMTSEVRALSDGKPAEVKTIYVGLGQAYFVSAKGEAGIGRPTDSGWQWQSANQLAPDIFQAMEILQNKAPPKFIPLPVKIQ